MAVSKENSRIVVTIPKEIKKEFEKNARKENRSLSNYVSTILIHWYEQLRKDREE